MKRDFWERPSIRANTRPDRLPVRTTPDDFLLPSGPGTVGMFLRTGVAGLAIAVFLVLGPMALFVAFTPVENLGSWWPWVTGIAWIGSWAALFVGGVRESRATQEWLADQ